MEVFHLILCIFPTYLSLNVFGMMMGTDAPVRHPKYDVHGTYASGTHAQFFPRSRKRNNFVAERFQTPNSVPKYSIFVQRENQSFDSSPV